MKVGFVVCLGVLITGCSVAASSRPAEPVIEPSSSPTVAPAVSWLRVAPGQGPPHSAVSLDVACLDNLGPVWSPVLDLGSLQADLEGHQPWHLSGTATVRPDAAPGRYRVSATCGATELSTDFTVLPEQIG
ncbi:MAG: hypothetical protein ACRDTA_01235 [Pseudonocardiaceae bacterium]